jgi:hypothetical protein
MKYPDGDEKNKSFKSSLNDAGEEAAHIVANKHLAGAFGKKGLIRHGATITMVAERVLQEIFSTENGG